MSNDSASVFGTVDFKPIDRLTLTAGFNDTDDSKRFSTDAFSTAIFSGLNLDAPQYAPFRYQLLYGGALASGVGTALGLGRSATTAEIGALAAANPAAYAQIDAGSVA